jgi:hypothetical protein
MALSVPAGEDFVLVVNRLYAFAEAKPCSMNIACFKAK